MIQFVRGLSLCLLVLPLLAYAQTESPSPCAQDPLYQELDFWVGNWEVLDTAGTVIGSNLIGKTMADCAIIENWSSVEGIKGMSLFYVDNTIGNWKQVWVTETAKAPGGTKEKMLMEKWPDGSLVFQGQYPYKEGTMHDRTVLTPLADGTVQQVIQYSLDDAQTWQTGFIGIYRRR